jgi:hypothetical protein
MNLQEKLLKSNKINYLNSLLNLLIQNHLDYDTRLEIIKLIKKGINE